MTLQLPELLDAVFLSEDNMGQEYFINSQELEDKIRSLLPSQGGAGAGFDLSASTQIIPVIDLTESAEGSNIRADLQTSFSHDSITSFDVNNTTTTIVNNTGYFRVFGNCSQNSNSTGSFTSSFLLNDGSTDKVIVSYFNQVGVASENSLSTSFDFIVFLGAGDSLKATTNGTLHKLIGSTRQIATIDGTLVNP